MFPCYIGEGEGAAYDSPYLECRTQSVAHSWKQSSNRGTKMIAIMIIVQIVVEVLFLDMLLHVIV